MSNHAYGTMPIYERPRSTGPGMGGGGFIPPPPGASQGGEPGHYPPFQQGYSSPFGWSTPNGLPPQNSTWTHHPSQQPLQPPQQHPSPWSYSQYPPPLDYPANAPGHTPGFPVTPITPTGAGRYSPYSSQSYQPPPASAPAQLAPWSYQLQQQQAQQQQQQHQHHQQPQQYSIPPIPYVDDRANYTRPKPFGGSANAPAPKKSAMKRSRSQSAVDRSRERRVEPSTFSGGSAFSSGGHGRRATEQLIPPVTIPNAPVYTRVDDETYTAKKLSSRPRDWRADYSTKQGISSYLPRIGRVRTDVEEYSDGVKRSMHPLLLHTLDSPPLAFDLRSSIMEGHNISFQTLGRKCNEVDLAQVAAHPPVPMLRLYHPRFPWYIDIHQSHPNGVTVYDVLVQLSRQMQAPIHSGHYFNETLDETDRTALATSFKERIKGRRGEREKGILQVDFLAEKCVLEGLVRGKQGMWEVKTRRPER